MASNRTWMHDLLMGPSLGQYFKIRSGKQEDSPAEDINATKQILKKHMVDSFFERALHQVDPNAKRDVSEQPAPVDEGVTFGYYIFAVALDQSEIRLPDEGIEPGFTLTVFRFDRVQAIISEVPLDIYGEETLQAHLDDPVWHERTANRHNGILARIQSQTSLVPVQVGTVCESMEDLQDYLQQYHDDFVSSLELVERNQAWRFSIFYNQRKLRHLIERASNRVRAIQEELEGEVEDADDPRWQELEAVLEEEARSVCKACLRHSHGVLSSLASRNLIHSQVSLEGFDQNMREIFRCEYMVAYEKEETFTSEFQTLIDSYKSLGFELAIEGPLTPAHFAKCKVLPAARKNQAPPAPPVQKSYDLGETA